MAFRGRRHVKLFRFLDQRAYPKDLGARIKGPPDGTDHVGQARQRQNAGIDGPAPGRLFGQARDVHVAISGQHEGAWDRRCRHHQDVHGATLGGQGETLVNAEAVLFVDYREGQVAKFDALLKERMGADRDGYLATGQTAEDGLAAAALITAGQKADLESGGGGQGLYGGQVLARQDLGRRHQGRLGAAFHGSQHSEQSHHGFAAADVALQEAQHAGTVGHVGYDFGQRRFLGPGQAERKGVEGALAQGSVAPDGAPGQAAHVETHQGQGELVGEQLVIGQACPRRRCWLQIGLALRRVGIAQRFPPRWPGVGGQERGIGPFVEVGGDFQGAKDRLAEDLERQAGGQGINRLHRPQSLDFGHRSHVVGVSDLDFVPEALNGATDDADLAHRQGAA